MTDNNENIPPMSFIKTLLFQQWMTQTVGYIEDLSDTASEDEDAFAKLVETKAKDLYDRVKGNRTSGGPISEADRRLLVEAFIDYASQRLFEVSPKEISLSRS